MTWNRRHATPSVSNARYPSKARSIPSRAGRPPALRKLGGPLIALGLILLKFGAKLKALLLLLPKLKLFTTSASMLVSIAAYALIWGWTFAVGFVLLLLVHELGHVIQLRREGVEASAPMFIPFLGAVIAAKSMGDDAAAEARVGLAGPMLGTHRDADPARDLARDRRASSGRRSPTSASSSTCSTCCPCCRSTAAGRWPRSAPGSGSSATPGLVVLTFVFPNPILILVLLFGGIETWRRWKTRNTPEAQAYHAIPGRTRALVALTYLGLAALLAVGVAETFLERDFSDVSSRLPKLPVA